MKNSVFDLNDKSLLDDMLLQIFFNQQELGQLMKSYHIQRKKPLLNLPFLMSRFLNNLLLLFFASTGMKVFQQFWTFF